MTRDGQAGEDVGQFLRTRRARLTPHQAGLVDYGGRRRVAGLRREEVATLAGISVEYYNRMERGNVRGVSDEVVAGLSRALHLDEVEHAHLIALVGVANRTPIVHRQPTRLEVRPAVTQLLDAMTEAAAFVRTARLEILGCNDLGGALYAPVLDSAAGTPNLARFVFGEPAAQRFYRDWDAIAHSAVGSLRTAVAQNPADRVLSDLIAELNSASWQFRSLWESHAVEYYRAGLQLFHHPDVGDLDLDYDALEVAADPGLTIVAYTAQPNSVAHQKLRQLAGHPTAGTS